MSSDLIQSMDTFPVRADVDGELHAIRLTNHRRIFLKRAYQKDDHGNNATDGDRVAGRTRSKDDWQAIVDVLTSGKPKETFNYLKKRKFRLDRALCTCRCRSSCLPCSDKIVPYCKIVFDIIHSAWVACLERDCQSGGTLSDCNTPSIGAVLSGYCVGTWTLIASMYVCFWRRRTPWRCSLLTGKSMSFLTSLSQHQKLCCARRTSR